MISLLHEVFDYSDHSFRIVEMDVVRSLHLVVHKIVPVGTLVDVVDGGAALPHIGVGRAVGRQNQVRTAKYPK